MTPGLVLMEEDVLDQNMFAMEGYTVEMDQTSGNTCVHGSNVLRTNGNAPLTSVLIQDMCVLGTLLLQAAKMNQIRIQ